MSRPKTGLLRPFLLSVVLGLGLASSLNAQVRSFGPLTFEEGGPLQRIGYTHRTESPAPLRQGEAQTDVWMGYANIFQQDSTATHNLFMDLERLMTSVGVRYGVVAGLEVGVRLSFETTGGGILDGFIQEWHQTLGLPNADRDLYPQGGYAQRLENGRGQLLLDVPRRRMGLDDLRLFTKWRALSSSDGRSLLSLRGVVKVPGESYRVGVQRTDASLMALGRLAVGSWFLHGSVGGATVRASRDFDGLLRSSSWFADVAVERPVTSWGSAVVQYSLSTPLVQGIGDSELDGWPGNLVFGMAGRLGEAWRWDVSFQEDVPAATPAVDFTLGIGLRRRW
ncbi:MAG: DUF3187 family protein [Gemmatimonadota bacterium]